MEIHEKARLAVLTTDCILSAGMTAGEAKNKFLKKSGETYYYDAKGWKVSGMKKIKGKMYFFEKQRFLKVETPYEKWDEYLNNYKTVR